jgi:thioredoxin reductase (NADPH)
MPAGNVAADAVLDCLVVGGGPAGLTSAIYLGRYFRSVLVVDKGWSRAEWIPRSHNLPGFPDGVEGPVLLDRMRAQARLYGAALKSGQVDALRRSDDGLFVAEVAGAPVSARTVILATGVVENKPPLPHVADAVKQGLIRTCPICDGYESRGKRIAVMGVGEHAAAEALFLRSYSDQLWLLRPRAAEPLKPETMSALDAAQIGLIHADIASVRLGEDGVTALSADDGQIHRFDVVYSAFGTASQTQLAKALGARMDDAGRLYVSEHQETSVKGLFAAGDLVRGLNQIVIANGEAATAATAIHNRLQRKPYDSARDRHGKSDG